MEQKEFKQLIADAIAGDKRAFEKLYRIFLKSILFSVSNQLDDASKVEDVAQDIVCEMYRRIGTLKAPEAFRSWMHTIIRRACYDANVKDKRHGMADSMHIDDFEETLCADDEYSEPDEAVGKSLAADRVRAIISKLPRARKQVIIMYYYDGLNDREIAEALGVSRSTVKTNLMRARESIRKALGNSGDIMGIDGENKYQGNNAAPSQTLALNGAAIAPLIVGVLKSEADAAFPAKLLASLGARFEHAVGAIPDASRLQAAQQAVQPPGQGKLGIISSTAVLVAVTLIAVTSQPPAEPARYEPPQATIEFVSDEPVESVNPSDVSLKIENSWGAVSWKLFKGGEELAGGEGEFGGQVKGLAAGNYRIEWEIKDGNGNRATVGRDFVIQPPAQ